MRPYDDVAAADSVFAAKGALDPLVEPTEIIPRTEQERALATSLSGVHEGVSAANRLDLRAVKNGEHLMTDVFAGSSWPATTRSPTSYRP